MPAGRGLILMERIKSYHTATAINSITPPNGQAYVATNLPGTFHITNGSNVVVASVTPIIQPGTIITFSNYNVPYTVYTTVGNTITLLDLFLGPTDHNATAAVGQQVTFNVAVTNVDSSPIPSSVLTPLTGTNFTVTNGSTIVLTSDTTTANTGNIIVFSNQNFSYTVSFTELSYTVLTAPFTGTSGTVTASLVTGGAFSIVNVENLVTPIAIGATGGIVNGTGSLSFVFPSNTPNNSSVTAQFFGAEEPLVIGANPSTVLYEFMPSESAPAPYNIYSNATTVTITEMNGGAYTSTPPSNPWQMCFNYDNHTTIAVSVNGAPVTQGNVSLIIYASDDTTQVGTIGPVALDGTGTAVMDIGSKQGHGVSDNSSYYFQAVYNGSHNIQPGTSTPGSVEVAFNTSLPTTTVVTATASTDFCIYTPQTFTVTVSSIYSVDDAFGHNFPSTGTIQLQAGVFTGIIGGHPHYNFTNIGPATTMSGSDTVNITVPSTLTSPGFSSTQSLIQAIYSGETNCFAGSTSTGAGTLSIAPYVNQVTLNITSLNTSSGANNNYCIYDNNLSVSITGTAGSHDVSLIAGLFYITGTINVSFTGGGGSYTTGVENFLVNTFTGNSWSATIPIPAGVLNSFAGPETIHAIFTPTSAGNCASSGTSAPYGPITGYQEQPVDFDILNGSITGAGPFFTNGTDYDIRVFLTSSSQEYGPYDGTITIQGEYFTGSSGCSGSSTGFTVDTFSVSGNNLSPSSPVFIDKTYNGTSWFQGGATGSGITGYRFSVLYTPTIGLCYDETVGPTTICINDVEVPAS